MPLSVMPTPHKFWRNDKTMEPSHLSQFGLTCAVLTEDLGAALLMWYREVFLVRTSQRPAEGLESTEIEAAFGLRWPGSFARWHRPSSSWRTAQCSLLGDLEEFSETWPRWGSMRDGECWAQTMPAHLTSESVSGSWVGTPTASMKVRSGTFSAGRTLNPAEMAMWPTPMATDGSHGGPNQRGSKGDLMLSSAAHLFPTPTATNTKANHMRGADKGKPRESRNYGTTGQLNPEWVEWLMGWPRGWTDLGPMSPETFREWLQGSRTESAA